ncbi:sigma-70 family RNA polymerase sigma factor [Oceanimonas baumannii]|uniref:sigma-70 family RNA polymerase sigma factor n=1 Tax=Oceanimonas baumannii TaxID=129578 RepID=UPI001D18C61F|nr:sigma-70 family RNA polymerase sigma factor [Oceanimonas baumannii]MCC4264484.1 sigma-70 family RNA polymerase sigma factor [Oceanimonas baumannii]
MTVISQATANSVAIMFREHHGWLSSFISRRVSCPEAGADLAQDTYLRLLVSGRLPEPDDSRRYLTHIAKGLVIDLYRRRRIEAAYLAQLQLEPEPVAISPEARVQMVEALVEIDALLHRLPNQVRQALLLRQLEGLSYKDIAARMQVSVSSVEKYVARALQACLLTALEQELI